MSRLVALLGRLSGDGISLDVEGAHLAVSPAERVTPELRDEIVRHRSDLMELARRHGPALLGLFRDCPSWPPPRGRSRGLSDPDAVLRAVGRLVSLRDGRVGVLGAVLYETRTGRIRCRVDFGPGRSLALDPEDVHLPPVAKGKSA